jgi:RNA polymerase sigma-70 factor (ECF subfamily)
MEAKRIYCVVPADLAGRLHDTLRRHFAEDSTVEVVVEQRRRDRRATRERRAVPGGDNRADERRRIHNPAGRRIADRRAPAVDLSTAEHPELPRRARRHADQLTFVERVAPSTEREEDLDTARLITRFQAGETKLFSELYLRYFDRVYGYVKIVLKDHHEAEDVSQQVFISALEALPHYERRAQPFRAWLFSIARNQSVSSLRKSQRLDVTDPEDIGDHQLNGGENGGDPAALNWVVDQDLMLLIERLPHPQRQALVLIEMMGLSVSEVAQILDRSPENVRMLKSRAIRFLRARLRALGRAPETRGRRESLIYVRQATVLRRRRFALLRR